MLLVNVVIVSRHVKLLYNLSDPFVFVLVLLLRVVEIFIRHLASEKLIFLAGGDIDCPPKFFVCF